MKEHKMVETISANGQNRTWDWVLKNAEKITTVRLENLPGVTEVPAFPAATTVRLWNLPGVEEKKKGAKA